MPTNSLQQRFVSGPGGPIAIHMQGDPQAPAVLMAHSILSSSMMWAAQAQLLASTGWRVIRADTRGHGQSHAPPAPYQMQDLVADHIAVLDALQIDRVHYVGLSLGGMSGFGLGIQHPDRLLSLCLCDARADMPTALGQVWNERMAAARSAGCRVLADPTTERWFGRAFLDVHPEIASSFHAAASGTSVEGFVGCAQAIQGLDYLDQVGQISTPTTLVVGALDGLLPQAMADLQTRLTHAVLEVIPDAGHLPNIDQPVLFNAALMRHLFQNPSWSQ